VQSGWLMKVKAKLTFKVAVYEEKIRNLYTGEEQVIRVIVPHSKEFFDMAKDLLAFTQTTQLHKNGSDEIIWIVDVDESTLEILKRYAVKWEPIE